MFEPCDQTSWRATHKPVFTAVSRTLSDRQTLHFKKKPTANRGIEVLNLYGSETPITFGASFATHCSVFNSKHFFLTASLGRSGVRIPTTARDVSFLQKTGPPPIVQFSIHNVFLFNCLTGAIRGSISDNSKGCFFSPKDWTDPGVHPPSYSMGTGLLPWGRRTGREAGDIPYLGSKSSTRLHGVNYRYALHNDVSVNDGPHIRRWSHKIRIL